MIAKESIFKELEDIALESGSSAVKQISPQEIIVVQWVRNKCQFGCPTYGKRFTCPPYALTLEETAATLQSYNKALLVEFSNVSSEQGQLESFGRMANKVLWDMERAAFLNGHQKAFFYGAGPCRLCRSCPAEKLKNPTLFSKKECKHPKEIRPSMEAAGIDVFETVRRAGLEVHVVSDRNQTFKSYRLLLLE